MRRGVRETAELDLGQTARHSAKELLKEAVRFAGHVDDGLDLGVEILGDRQRAAVAKRLSDHLHFAPMQHPDLGGRLPAVFLDNAGVDEALQAGVQSVLPDDLFRGLHESLEVRRVVLAESGTECAPRRSRLERSQPRHQRARVLARQGEVGVIGTEILERRPTRFFVRLLELVAERLLVVLDPLLIRRSRAHFGGGRINLDLIRRTLERVLRVGVEIVGRHLVRLLDLVGERPLVLQESLENWFQFVAKQLMDVVWAGLIYFFRKPDVAIPRPLLLALDERLECRLGIEPTSLRFAEKTANQDRAGTLRPAGTGKKLRRLRVPLPREAQPAPADS